MKHLFVLILVLTFLTSCAGEFEVGPNAETGRMVMIREPLPMSNLLGLPLPPVASLSLQLTSALTPPTVNGNVLTAADVIVDGSMAYVSYNFPGNTQAGAIDQVQASILTQPILAGSKTFSTTDIHSLAKLSNTLYAVGSDVSLGAALYKVDMAGGVLNSTSATQSVPLRSFAGTGVVVKGSTVYTTSGDGSGTTPGGIDFFTATTLVPTLGTVTANRDILDLRSITYNPAGTSAAKTDSLYMISGKNAGGNSSLYEYSDAGVLLSTTDLGSTSNTIRESKSSLAVGKTMVAVSQGDNGFKVICAKNKSTLVSVARVNETPTVALEKSVTNSITMSPGLIFAANGEAGIYVYSFTQALGTVSTTYPCGSGAVNAVLLGKINLGAGVSVNNVKYQSLSVGVLGIGISTGVLYAATTTGFRLISVTQTNVTSDITDF